MAIDKTGRVIAACTGTDPAWEYEVTVLGGLTTITLGRGDETMEISWDAGGSLVHPLTYVLAGIKEVKLRNVMAAVRIINAQPTYKKVRREAAERTAPAAPAVVPLPFDVDTATDAEIIKAVRGKTLTWINEMAGEYESAVVPAKKLVEIKDPDNPGQTKKVWRTSANITMSTSAAGRRILTFPAVHEQYRSVGLDRLVQVK